MRNRYLDLLRAAAIVRVIVYHLFGWPWLSILLPAMGIMFALAGSLTAASLDKRSASQVITSRLRRLLPPLWLLAVIAVPAMLFLGWAEEDGGDEPLSWKLGLWLLPIGDPPGSEKGIDVWEPLWYVRAYLWFVVLSPLLYLAYKKIGWGAVAAPVVLIAVLDKTGFALPFGRADAAMWDFATYGACWIAGFAHHDGRLARIRPGRVVAASAVMGLAALYWLRGHPSGSGWDLNEVSESQALWSLAFVLLALRWQPDMSWLRRSPRLDGAVTLLNNRAVTVYLWHNIAIAAIWPVLTVLTLDDLGDLDGPTDLIASLVLTLAAVLAFGWAEDLAARRRPALWPTRSAGRRPEAEPSPVVPAGPAGPVSAGMPAGPVSAGRTAEGLDYGDPASRPTGGLRPEADPVNASRTTEGAGYGDLASRPTGDLSVVGTDNESDPPGRGGDPGFGGGSFGSRGTGSSGFASSGSFEGSREAPDPAAVAFSPSQDTGPGGAAQEAPWARAGVAPIVVGDNGGFTSRRRDHVAPFPEAEVLFGLPDARAGFGGDRDDHAEAARHAVRPTEPFGSPEPPHDPDDRAAAGPWFGGEHGEPK
ncbi:acyltransferase [Actinoplanes sp. ATCC 53533]|uniref:acyltransferase family protein n=1 Tax=Actinoplanes sp. ATCC 53533 TaxID=1288362 RepID=UPI000F7AFA77|nr:acyltransferase family protein [Actinoplanes sp. ATCC 53533]RSM55709.1 acyltransferase [Actinoplanes sp. ATCC 53533]